MSDSSPVGVEALVSDGVALARAGRLAEAEALLQRATSVNSQHAAAWSNLGTLLGLLKRPDDAVACFHKALALNPADAVSRRNLAILLRQSGATEDSMRVLRPAAGPGAPADLVLPAHLALSPVAQSREDIIHQRTAFARGLEDLAARPGRLVTELAGWTPPTFPLAYHGLDDRELMVRTGEVLSAKVEGLAYASPSVAAWRAPNGRPARLLIVSDHLANHTVGRVYHGLIAELDRGAFEVVVAHGGPADDPVRSAIDAAADAALVLPPDLAGQRAAVEQIAPDAIFYPDLGMSGPSYRLAFSRLAPVQFTAWGHPDTTGLPSIDYYVSTARFEPPGAQAHYAERLVELGDVPCHLEPPLRATEPVGREALGLPARGRLYACPQTVFKLHPDFDALLARIAEADPEGWIVIPEPHEAPMRQALLKRWRGSSLPERVHFAPRVPSGAFMAQLKHFDVLLDPPHFGSGYTFYLAMADGAPVVTLPGAFARGRMACGFYEQMGAGGELVMRDEAAYIRVALDLAHSPSRQRDLRERLRDAAGQRLYRDKGVVREFEAFLRRAIDEATFRPPPA